MKPKNWKNTSYFILNSTRMDQGKPKKPNPYARFSTVGIQMAITIAGFTWLGVYLDEKQKNDTAIWTIVLSLTGVFASMYLIFKEVKKMNDDESNSKN